MDADTLKTIEALVDALVEAERLAETGAWRYEEPIAAGRALIAQIQRDAVQPGWKLVPVEPTREMLTAWLNEPARTPAHELDELGELRDASFCYRAMIAAAPHPEAQALDSQLQQPDGHSTRGDLDASYGACAQHGLAHPCEVCAAESVTAQMEAALAECRDLFPIPAPGEPAETEWLEAMSYPPSVPAFIRASLAATSSRSAAGDQQQDDHAGSPAPSACQCCFDAWRENPYTKVLEKSIDEDYVPRVDAESSKAALSDEEIKAAAMEAFDATWDADDETLVNKYGHGVYFSRFLDFARAILARAGIGESRHE